MDVDLIRLIEDKEHRRAVVNTVMNLHVPYHNGNFLLAEEPLVLQEGGSFR
jgi:hypothetical protein